jgi:hypothetical protein
MVLTRTERYLVLDLLKEKYGLTPPRDKIVANLWLRLTGGRKQFRRCENCRFSFEVSRDRGGARKSRKYCSNRCKIAAWRRWGSLKEKA